MELSILKQRLARRLEFEGHTDSSIEGVDLVELTKVSNGRRENRVRRLCLGLNRGGSHVAW